MGPRTDPCGTSQVRGDGGELCGRIPTVDVRVERYEVNHCSKTEEKQYVSKRAKLNLKSEL